MITNLNSTQLRNGFLTNGVANFYTATKPITRVDGSALVVGDKWYNPVSGIEGFWNGTLWLSSLYLLNSTTGAGNYTSLAGILNLILPIPKSNFVDGMHIKSFALTGKLSAANDISNNLSLRLQYNNTGGDTTVSTIRTDGKPAGFFSIVQDVDIAAFYPAAGIGFLPMVYSTVGQATVGVPGSISAPAANISYRLILV
jgi:hypothetical protein